MNKVLFISSEAFPLIKTGGRFRRVSWDQAAHLTSERFQDIIAKHGPDSIGVLVSAKITNEENYIANKFARAVLKTNNIDHCARLCHAGSVTGLQLAIGSSAMSNAIAEMENLDTFIVTGSNTTETHPVISNFLKRAVRQNGANAVLLSSDSAGALPSMPHDPLSWRKVDGGRKRCKATPMTNGRLRIADGFYR